MTARTYSIRVRTPDDPDGWTAVGEGPVGHPYSYVSNGIVVELTFGQPRRQRVPREPRTHKRCSVCETVKPLTEFYRLAVGGEGRDYYCAACRRAKNAADRDRDRDLWRLKERERWIQRAAKGRLEWGSHGGKHPSARKNCATCVRLGRVSP